MDRLKQYIERSRNGNAILFCGAGLTADCLNFEDDSTVGVTFHLLKILNEELKRKGKTNGFKDIRNAAKQFNKDIGNHYLMELLKVRFRLSKVSTSIVDIMKYPWAGIYTTNYDNGIELALQAAGKKFALLNNLDDPNLATSGTPVVHLHGCAEAWTDKNFEKSCILDVASYYSLPGVKKWLDRLRYDIGRAETVIFIGFSAADFHLSQVFFNSSGLQQKAFFINRPSANPDTDERATQEDFGEPRYVGREDFSDLILNALNEQIPCEPKLASFHRYEPPIASAAVPQVKDIEDLFLWGRIVPEHLKRDRDLSRSDYHVLRHEASEIQSHLGKEGAVVFLHGEICEGKTLVVGDVVNGLYGTRPIFELRHAYSDLLDEAAAILSAYPNALFVAENCFSLNESHLMGLSRQVSASAAGLVLSARSISTDGESGKLRNLRSISSFVEIRIGRLLSEEVDALVTLIDQIAG